MQPVDDVGGAGMSGEPGDVPDADVAAPGPDDAFRDALETDSLDFPSFVEVLSERAGVRIEDEDTPQLSTLSGSAGLLVSPTQ